MDNHFSHLTLYYGLMLADRYMRANETTKAASALAVLRRAHGFNLVESIMVFWHFQEVSLKRPLR